jgi:two-component system sensor kinase
MIQEALTNVAKHAHATRCTVRLRRIAEHFEIEVHDNGTGFQPPDLERPNAPSGLGLIGMRERALQLAGVVSVQSEPGRGTRLRIVLQLGPDPQPFGPPSGLPVVATLSRG